jgi:hypothetical protein
VVAVEAGRARRVKRERRRGVVDHSKPTDGAGRVANNGSVDDQAAQSPIEGAVSVGSSIKIRGVVGQERAGNCDKEDMEQVGFMQEVDCLKDAVEPRKSGARGMCK